MDVRRREFITVLGGAAAAWPFAARAQQSSPALIGVLNASAATTFTKELDTLRGALRDLGHVEGRNVCFEYRFADGDLDRLPGLAAELVGLNPNVIVTFPLPTKRELLPRLARLAALINVTNPLHVPQWRETKAAAAQAAVALVPFEFRSPDQFEAAFATFSRERADALLVPPDVPTKWDKWYSTARWARIRNCSSIHSVNIAWSVALSRRQ
jgi:putative ABC transport system substrate-binding protein